MVTRRGAGCHPPEARGLAGRSVGLARCRVSHLGRRDIPTDMGFHSGERAVQRRAGVEEDARAVGRGIGRTLTPAIARFLARQRLAVAASLDDRGRVWASLLAGTAEL